MSIFSRLEKKRKEKLRAGLAKFEGRINISKEFWEPRDFKVEEGFSYRSSKGKLTALPGFITDGASVPQLFWFYMPPFAGLYLLAVILHDLLYAAQIFSRKICDEIMKEALIDLGVRRTQVEIVYALVRAGGWVAWNKNKKKAESQRRFLVVTA